MVNCCNPCKCDDSCQEKPSVIDIIATLITRVLFILQCMISIWRVVDVKKVTDELNYKKYWLLGVLLLGLILDSIYTIGIRKGKEYKWASSSFFFFLVAAVPPIWLLELDRYYRYNERKNSNISVQAEKLSDIYGISFPLELKPDQWVQALEQSLIMLVAVTRWIQPRGAISRERLSQILLVYVALGADIIEIFNLFEEKEVMEDYSIYIAILAVWSFSLCQFSLLMASSEKGRKARFSFIGDPEYSDPKSKSRKNGKERRYDPIEVASLCMTMVFQDIPFLCVRLYMMAKHKLITNTLFFFACKNVYVIMLQIYRILVITCLPPEDGGPKEQRRESKANGDATSDTVSVQLDSISVGVEVDPDPSATSNGSDGTNDIPMNDIPMDRISKDGNSISTDL